MSILEKQSPTTTKFPMWTGFLQQYLLDVHLTATPQIPMEK